MTGKRLSWAVLATVVILATGVFLMWPRTRQAGYPPDIPKWFLNSEQRNADLKMENVEYTNNRDGRDEWVLYAKFARYFKGEEEVLLDSVRTNFFLKSGKTVTVSGEHGTYDTQSKDINLWGHVSAIASDGGRFYTNAITYNSKERVLRTPEEVTVLGSKIDLKGKGLLYELNTGKMSVLKEVRVITQRKLK